MTTHRPAAFASAAPSRRTFLHRGSLVLAGLAAGPRLLAEEAAGKPAVRVGLVTDVHYADKATRINRYYRDSLDKLDEAVDRFNDASPDFVALLGDMIDHAGDVEKELVHLSAVEKSLNKLRCDRQYVLGNHCVDGLTKEQFREHSRMTAPHHAFEQGGVRFITLDACFRSDGTPYGQGNFDWTDANIPDEQLAWLEDSLAADETPAIIFAHQRLDDAGNHSVKNAPAVRGVLEQSGRVAAVFQGHAHKDEHQQINGIDYCTLVALVEGPGPDSSAYSLLSVYEDGSLQIEGFRRQPDRRLA